MIKVFTLFLATCLTVMAMGDSGNVFEIKAVGKNRFSLTFKLKACDFESGRASFVESDVIQVDRSEESHAPVFARTIEVEAGRYTSLDGVALEQETMVLPGGVSWLHTDEDAVAVQLARMGRRVLVRVEVRPFLPSLTDQNLTVYRSIEATFSLSEKEQESKRQASGVLDVFTIVALDSEEPAFQICPSVVPIGVSEGTGQPGDFAAHRSVTNSVAWKIRISQAGMYRISGAELEGIGIPAVCRTASQLRLTSRDQEVPMWASTSGVLSEADWVMFYGAAAESAFSTQNVYWLSINEGNAAPEQLDATPVYGGDLVTSSWARVDYAPKNIYDAAYNPLVDDYDHWFALQVAGGTTSNIAFETPYPVSSGQAYLSYKLHGLNATPTANPDHRSVLRVGGSLADTREYDGQVEVTDTVSVPATSIGNGSTVVSVAQQVPSGVQHPSYSDAYVEWLRLCYPRHLIAQSLPFFFNGPATSGTVRVAQIPAGAFWLLDVSDPLQPKELLNYCFAAEGAAWRVDFEDGLGGGRCFAIFNEASVKSVLSIESVHFRNLTDTTRQADYLVVTPDLFREPVYRLLTHRYKNDLTVQVATPEDIYNEFSYGMIDPVAIRQYFGYAYHHYQKDEPRYALLVGAGSFDPLNRLGSSGTNHIPVHLGAAAWRRTAYEQWFATIDGSDYLPDIAVGRIPAFTKKDVSNVVNKLVSFETAAVSAWWRETALLVADKVSGSLNFKAFTEANTRSHLVKGAFDPVFGIQTAYLDDMNSTTVNNTIKGAIDDGVHFVNFMGHGGVTQWSSPSIWKVENATALSNAVYPIVSVFTCQNGRFMDPSETCLMQAMLINARGASGMVAPTALAVQLYSEKLADGYFEAVAEDRVERLGDAMQAGFLRLWSFNPYITELRFYGIFGDPAQKIWGGAQP